MTLLIRMSSSVLNFLQIKYVISQNTKKYIYIFLRNNNNLITFHFNISLIWLRFATFKESCHSILTCRHFTVKYQRYSAICVWPNKSLYSLFILNFWIVSQILSNFNWTFYGCLHFTCGWLFEMGNICTYRYSY